MNTLRILVFISLLSNLGAVTLWTEGIGGANDLSDDYLNPNAFTVGLGENLITAEVNSVETSPGVFAANQDFFTIIVPNDIQVTGLFLLGYSFDGAAGNKTFLGYQNGATLLQAPETFTQDTAGLIADLLFGSAEIVSDPFSYPFDPTETNLFDNFGDGDFATPAPLTPGTYAFWIREIEPEIARFTLDFRTTSFTPVPEASTSFLTVLATLSFFFRRQRQ